MSRVAIVTDSTAYLPDGMAEKYGVTVVPLQVVLGGRSGAEGVDVTPADVANALRERRSSVTTSRPAPRAFAAAYEKAAADSGTDAVVSVHLSGELSGTVDAGRLAADSLPDLDIRIVDSRSTAM